MGLAGAGEQHDPGGCLAGGADPGGQAGYLIATAARAPSVQNTQPWRFHVSQYVIELHADSTARRLT